MPVFREIVYLGLTLYIHEAFVDFNGCYQFLRSTVPATLLFWNSHWNYRLLETAMLD